MIKKVNRHTRAGRNGKVVQCPKCGSLQTLYGFSFCAITCTDCEQMVDKYDLIIPELTSKQTLDAIHEREIDNAIRTVVATVNKNLWGVDTTLYMKRFRMMYPEIRNLVAAMRVEIQKEIH